MQDWLYSTELFQASTILKMAANFETLLRNAILRPEMRLSSLEIFTAEEKQRIENEKNERKQMQRKKLTSVEPKIVNLAIPKTDQP